MKKHYLTFHEEHVKKERISCPQCEKTFGPDSKHNLKKHIASKHEQKKISCQKCNIDFTLPDALVTHNKNKHQMKKSVKLKCDHCGYQTIAKQNLRTHIQRMHRVEDFHQETLRSYNEKNSLGYNGDETLKGGEQLSNYHLELQFEKLKHQDFQNTRNQKKFEIIKQYDFEKFVLHCDNGTIDPKEHRLLMSDANVKSFLSTTCLIMPYNAKVYCNGQTTGHWQIAVFLLKQSKVLLFCSLSFSVEQMKKVCQSLLKFWLANKKTQLAQKFQEATNWTFEIPEVPLQKEGSQDCGIFALEYCRRIIMNETLNLPILANKIREKWIIENKFIMNKYKNKDVIYDDLSDIEIL